jgi:hypothetical protein
MARVGTIDDRFQSHNVEMLEVTGGRFWKPYKDIAKTAGPAGSEAKGGDASTGMSPGLYQYRPPIDLTNRRLRAMAGALGPAYVRISGTWVNTTCFADMDTAPKDPPQGYGGVLTRQSSGWARSLSRVIISCSLPMNADDTGLFIGRTSSGAEQLAKKLRRAKVVSAFGTVPSEVFFDVFGRQEKSKTPEHGLLRR